MIDIGDILKLDDLHRKVVVIPEWNGVEITVVSMTAAERADIERLWVKKDPSTDPAAFRIDILSRCIKRDDGTPWGTPEDFRLLMGKNSRAIERLYEAAEEVSGWNADTLETLEKN